MWEPQYYIVSAFQIIVNFITCHVRAVKPLPPIHVFRRLVTITWEPNKDLADRDKDVMRTRVIKGV